MQEEVNTATERIGNLLSASYDKASAKVENGQTVNWRSDPKFYKPPKNPAFPPGSVDFSPGWFALAHEVRTLFLPACLHSWQPSLCHFSDAFAPHHSLVQPS